MTDQKIDKIDIKSISSLTSKDVAGLPKHWEVKKLGDVCEKLSLNKIKIKQRDYLKEGKYPVVDQGQELIGGYYNDDTFVVPKEPPYIVFGDHTKVKKYINFKFVAGADGVKVIKSKANVDSKFLYYLIHAIKIDDKGYARHFQLLEKSDLPIPPLPEQQAIVAKIEELLSELDNGKQQLLTAQKQLKVYRQSLLKWAFEGKLTNSENIKIVSLGSVIEKPKYGTSKKCDYKTNGIGVLRIPNIANGVIDASDLKFAKFSAEELETYSLNTGDLLIIRSNGSVDLVGKCAFVNEKENKFLFAGYLIRLRPLREKINPMFLQYILSSHNLRIQIESKAKSTSGVNNINTEEIKSLQITLPSLSEQQLIVSELESKLTICDKIEETISQSLLQAETLRQSILKKAFEGKLVNTNKYL